MSYNRTPAGHTQSLLDFLNYAYVAILYYVYIHNYVECINHLTKEN